MLGRLRNHIRNHASRHVYVALQLLLRERMRGRFLPVGNLIQGTNGLIYGTTGLGGADGDGTIYDFP